MSLLKYLVSLLLLTGCFSLFAQHQEGMVEYAITVKPGDTTQYQKQRAALMFDSKMALHFNDTMSRMDFKMGKGMLTSIIVNLNRKKGLSLTSSSKGKFAYFLTEDYFEPKKEGEVKVELIDEKATILGYSCKKALMYVDGIMTTYWYTNDFTLEIKNQEIVNKHIPGFPLKYSTVKDGLFMEFEVSNILFSVKNPELVFSMAVPEGFKMLKK
jgi:GLPGLI family protein